MPIFFLADAKALSADGYPRCLSNLGRVIINGKYAPILGRVPRVYYKGKKEQFSANYLY